MRHALFAIPALLLPAIIQAQVPVDDFINLDNVSPQAPGTQLTTTTLGNGSMGALSGWSLTGTSSSMTVGNHQSGCNLGIAVTVNGGTYTSASPSESFALNNSSNFSYWMANTSSGHTKISIGWCEVFGAIPTATNLMDMVRVDATSGFAAIAQLRPGSGPGCLNIEASGVVHSPCITLSNGGTYWCSLFVDTAAGNSQLACYQPTAPFTQVGSTVTRSFTPGIGNILRVLVGNAETGTAAGTTTYFENMIFAYDSKAVFPLGVGSGSSVPNTPWGSVLAPSRAMDWSQAGVAGGVPNRTTICQTLNPGATSTQINSAIASCPANQVVFLNAGTYSGLSGINFTGTNHVTLRGAGADQTLLVFSSTVGCNEASGTLVCIGGTDNNWKGGPSNTASWTAGYSVGTTQVTLSSVTNLKVGNIIILDQLDDDQTGCDTGGIFVSQIITACTVGSPVAPGINGPYSLQGNGGGSQRSGRQQQEIHLVAGCNGSTTAGFACSGTNVVVTLAEGLIMPNWRSGQTPQAWWPTTPITGDGIENLTVNGTNVANGTGVQFKNASNSWVKGVRIIDTNRAHVQRDLVTHITERDSYQFMTQNSATQSYGDECFGDSFGLVENNIFHAVAGPVVINSACVGMVISYNFAINDYYTPSPGWNETGSSLHTSGVAFILYEGNSWNQVESDVFHGTHHLVTQFRNSDAETQPVCFSSGSSYATAIYAACNNNLSQRTMAFSRFYNFVGNVIGTAGVQVGYQSGNPAIWSIGNGNSANGVNVSSDPNVATTMMRWGNYDTFNAAATFSSAEVPSALTGVQAPFSNPLPASQNLPASFYLSAKPSWWPAAKPWPGIGPDVTGGNVLGVGGHAYTIPAQDCYLTTLGGLLNGTGAVLNFNANACYYGGSATLPAPPTGLKAVVN